MKPPRFLLSGLMVVALAVTESAVGATPESQDQAYRQYLEDRAAYKKEALIRNVVALPVFAGLVVFLVAVLRASKRGLELSKRALELNEQQQKTLEEIRDLLKKQ